ncbi:hypothetical protein C0993_001166 [Termitomyces sp. T159_Od127]|nr:hypothetical protein C0993_001166 [Termitomyces sp. T159_Od127]
MPAFSKAPLEASVWYLAPFWVGVLNNITFDKIPISRLTAADLSKRSGAITALVIIVIVVFILALNQVRVMRKTGWLPHYLKWYIIGGLVLLVISQLPGLELRIHHYIISMALIPGTAFPTRMSAILQAFLLGMFLNGAAAFGYDSILQTAVELQEDGPSGSLLPTFLTNSTNYNSSIPLMNQTIFWDVLPSSWDGFSLLVDDVERYAGSALNFSLAAFDPVIPHFFRLAHHERHSEGHGLNVIERERQQWMSCEPDPAAWDEPEKNEFELTKEEVRMRESQTHVDLVRDMVPFWIRGVEAAERGEVLRLEEFLETLETSGWGGCVDDDGWGNGWKIVDEKKRKESRRRKRRQRQTNSYQFVEDVARRHAADEARKQRMHSFFEDKDSYTTPWWDELRRCVEGDHVPSKTEGWNHPVALILAVSTTAPNPLQAVAALHSRALEFPPWVDTNILRYTLIIHPENSPLSNEEAVALFNAVKKQYGLHSYLLSLSLPTPPPPAVPVPALIPRLPPLTSQEKHKSPLSIPKTPVSPGLPADPSGPNTLRLAEKDIQQTARFTLFIHPSFTVALVFFYSPSLWFSISISVPLAQYVLLCIIAFFQRRLAEFATILGDLKLAVTVWEALRKDGQGGSDMLPMLSSPSPALPLHAANALSGMQLQVSDPRPHEQLTALKYAVRWEAGISTSDFLNSPVEGERWLVWAAGNSEEPPAALLLAHAALLSSRKQAKRRAAFWYLSAANRLEKCGIKPLTMFFLRQAHELYNGPQKSLSPSFWESEGQSPLVMYGIDAIMSGIEYPLGRLLYTTGDVANAVRFFLGLLRGSTGKPFDTSYLSTGSDDGNKLPGADKVYLDDFRVAYAHFKETLPESKQLKDLKLPFTFCLTQRTRLRLTGDVQDAVSEAWESLEELWKKFSKSIGCKEGLSGSGKASVNEIFWVDLVLRNPLNTEVNLSNLTVIVEGSNVQDTSASTISCVEVQVISDIVLGAKESQDVSIAIKSSRATSLVVTHATYDFLSLLPSAETLASRGRRLHDTAAQRLQPSYAPDVQTKVEIEDMNQKLLVFVDDEQLVLAQGERKELKLHLSNAGDRPIKEIWVVAGPDDEIWLGQDEGSCDDAGDVQNPMLNSISALEGSSASAEVIQSNNSLEPRKPLRIPLELNPGESFEYPILIHAHAIGRQALKLLFVHRENEKDHFRSARVFKEYVVYKLLNVLTSSRPHQSADHLFLIQLEISSLATSVDVHFTQMTCMSPTWICRPLAEHGLGTLAPLQSSLLTFGLDPWDGGSAAHETFKFVSKKLRNVLHGQPVESSDPPPIDLLCSYMAETKRSISRPSTLDLIWQSKRGVVTRGLTQSHPHIPNESYPKIFPLYHPASVDFVVFWEIPSQHRSGYITSTLSLGAGHAALGSIIEEAEDAKVKRSMYAETQREKEEILDAIRNSEWNTEMNPAVLVLQGPCTTSHDFSLGFVFILHD